MTDFDTIVIGVGGMGSSAAYHLARRGQDVLGLERYSIPHTMGSSHGVTRIVRKTSYENPAYLPLLERAYELWHELDSKSTDNLIHTHGYVATSPEDGSLFRRAVEACEAHDLEHSVLTAPELSDRYPGYDLPSDYMAVIEPNGGFVHAEQSIVAHVKNAHRHGAVIRAQEEVLDWSTSPNSVEVMTSDGHYSAKNLVVTAGAWASRLVPKLESVAVPERQVIGWFQPTQHKKYLPEEFPVFSAECDLGQFYGTPVYHVPGFKIGKHHHLHQDVEPDSIAEPTDEDETVLREFAKEYLSAAAGPTMGLKTCMYTNSPDGEFIVDTLSDDPNVAIAGGFSGHGFKFTTVMGEILADLAIHGETQQPIDSFSANRFNYDANVTDT